MFLDRWRRQVVLVRANMVRLLFVVATAGFLLRDGPRGWPFYLAALAAVSVNRFYLAALSTALPRVVAARDLVVANSLTTTTGTVVATAGGGLGLVIRRFSGAGDRGSAVVAVTSCLLYAAAAAIAARIPVGLLGPDDIPAAPLSRQLAQVAHGLAAGARHVSSRRRAARALLAISAGRLLFGMSTIGTLLLYRNYFHDDGVLRAGLVGLGQAFGAAAVGYVAAAIVTPPVTARIGKPAWIVTVYSGLAIASLGFGLPFAPGPLLAGALLLGFATSAAKICVDTIVQEDVEDRFRGRVFSFYDTLFNLTFIVAAVVAAFTVPADGKSYPVLFVISVGYAVIAAGYGFAERRELVRQ